MTTNLAYAAPAHPAEHATDMMAAIRTIAANLAPRAADIDAKGLYPEDAMHALGEAGAFSAHLADQTRLASSDLGFAIRAMAEIATSCMSTAFCMWCQDACGWYLENTGNTDLRRRLQPGIAHAALLGGTGLSNPVKALSGIEKFKLRTDRVDGGYIATGILPWVSNLGDGHWFGTVLEDAADPQHRLMAMLRCGAPGVTIKQSARFIALEGTGTYSILLRKAFIPDSDILADPLADMVKRVKPGFILLQTGMGLGVIQACITLMHEANRPLGHTNRYLPRQAAYFEDELASLAEEIARLAATPAGRIARLRPRRPHHPPALQRTLARGLAGRPPALRRPRLPRRLGRPPPPARKLFRRHHHPVHQASPPGDRSPGPPLMRAAPDSVFDLKPISPAELPDPAVSGAGRNTPVSPRLTHT